MRFYPGRRVLGTAFVLGALAVAGVTSAYDNKKEQKGDGKDAKPSLSLKVSPSVSFAPARVVLIAELKRGPNDYEEYYCAGTEWDWGDGTTSESSNDCEPYEQGKSEIKRRFATEHVFRVAGNYRVNFRLKRKDKILVASNALVTVRPGLRDPGQD